MVGAKMSKYPILYYYFSLIYIKIDTYDIKLKAVRSYP